FVSLGDRKNAFRIFGSPFPAPSAATEVHQYQVDREPMEPGIELAVAPERLNLLHQMKKNFLGQFFRFRRVMRHSYTHRVDAPVLAFKPIAEGCPAYISCCAR